MMDLATAHGLKVTVCQVLIGERTTSMEVHITSGDHKKSRAIIDPA
jgi:hypothetical protein